MGERAEPIFLSACRRQPVPRVPVWLMRQAGRYLPEYRAVRERHSMADLLSTPELAAEVTLQPLRRFDLDAAIIFSDLLPPLSGMGLAVTWDKGGGPRVEAPLSSPRDIDMLAVPPAAETLGGTLKAIGLVREELEKLGKPLIGFAGAPFTLASYAVEGGTSRTFTKTKALMYGHPAAWARLMGKLVTVLSDFLAAQAGAGAAALQVFDSWAGIALGRDDYRRYVQPWNKRLFDSVRGATAAGTETDAPAARAAGVPLINFSTGTAAWIDDVSACGGDVISVDWRLPLDCYVRKVGPGKAIQGNLDPAALLAPWRELEPRVRAILEAAPRSGYVFNLGHGVLPETSPDTVARLVEYVHAWDGDSR